MITTLTTFDQNTTAALAALLTDQHRHIAQLDQTSRGLTARNYDSAIRALGDYLQAAGHNLPTKTALESWRDSMLADGKAVRTVNARLSAARKLLRAVADDVTDIHIKLVLNDWSKVKDAKAVSQSASDKTEVDYGRRLTLAQLQQLIRSIDTHNLKGLRDRAIIALMAGAGLRVSEVVKLTMRDVFLATNETGQRGIKVLDGKHHKARVVVLDGNNSWVLKAVQAYTDALELSALEQPGATIIRGVRPTKTGYNSYGQKLSTRKAQMAVESYPVTIAGESVTLNAHDLRRTYAKLCKSSGMEWDALRANMGHSSVTVTEAYVGKDVDWSERMPNWKLKLD